MTISIHPKKILFFNGFLTEQKPVPDEFAKELQTFFFDPNVFFGLAKTLGYKTSYDKIVLYVKKIKYLFRVVSGTGGKLFKNEK